MKLHNNGVDESLQPEVTKVNQSSIQKNAQDLLEKAEESYGIFTIKTGSKWLKQASCKPVPMSLFLDVWFEGEVCILYAETNLGKSTLAVQIANSISEREPVIYFDFELSDKQFEKRYSDNFRNHYPFPDNFLRAEINPDEADYMAAGFNDLEDYINASIEQAVQQTGARVLIIDNLTYLRSETEKSREALPLMKHLKRLKNLYSLSILTLAHTPKRNTSQPLGRNDLAGSKMLINFCDSAFALGESAKDKRLRYLKQIKSRSTEIIYDADNVAVFEVNKAGNFLTFTHVHTSSEHEHLRHYTKEDREVIISQTLELRSKGKSQREISLELGIGLGTVNKYLNCSRSQ